MDTKIIIPSVGPYAGQRMTVDPKEADQAISEGWATDPFAPPPPAPKEGEAAKPPKELTDEERGEMAKKADAAAKRWRGEDEGKDKSKAKTETRDMSAGERHAYETRAEAPKAEAAKTETHRRR